MKKDFSAQNANKPAQEVPDDFGAKLILFRNISKKSPFHSLNDTVLLAVEDEKESDYIFGLVLNDTWHQSFHKYMKSEGHNLHEQFHFVRMAKANSSAEEFQPVESNIINLLRRSDSKSPLPGSFVFKDFALSVCETSEEARDIAQYIGHHEDILVLYSQIFLSRKDVADLVKQGKAAIRDADPDIVFNKSAYMRAMLSFPEHFEGRLPKNGPAPKAP